MKTENARSASFFNDGGRAGLVGRQSVRNNWSRIGGLDYFVDNAGTITDAVSAQVWSGEAAIVNWRKGDNPKPPYHLSVQRGDSVDARGKLSSYHESILLFLSVTM